MCWTDYNELDDRLAQLLCGCLHAKGGSYTWCCADTPKRTKVCRCLAMRLYAGDRTLIHTIEERIAQIPAPSIEQFDSYENCESCMLDMQGVPYYPPENAFQLGFQELAFRYYPSSWKPTPNAKFLRKTQYTDIAKLQTLLLCHSHSELLSKLSIEMLQLIIGHLTWNTPSTIVQRYQQQFGIELYVDSKLTQFLAQYPVFFGFLRDAQGMHRQGGSTSVCFSQVAITPRILLYVQVYRLAIEVEQEDLLTLFAKFFGEYADIDKPPKVSYLVGGEAERIYYILRNNPNPYIQLLYTAYMHPCKDGHSFPSNRYAARHPNLKTDIFSIFFTNYQPELEMTKAMYACGLIDLSWVFRHHPKALGMIMEHFETGDQQITSTKIMHRTSIMSGNLPFTNYFDALEHGLLPREYLISLADTGKDWWRWGMFSFLYAFLVELSNRPQSSMCRYLPRYISMEILLGLTITCLEDQAHGLYIYPQISEFLIAHWNPHTDRQLPTLLVDRYKSQYGDAMLVPKDIFESTDSDSPLYLFVKYVLQRYNYRTRQQR